MMKKLHIASSFTLILLALAGCSPTWLGLDSGLFSGEPCKAPCWQNLTPGLSTEEAADRFVDDLGSEAWPGRYERVYDSGCRWIRVSDKSELGMTAIVDLYIEDGELAFLQSTPPLGPTLRQVTNQFGQPEYFKALEAIGPDGKLDVLEIYYPAQGIAFQVHVNSEDAGRIKPNMRIIGIEYFPPGDLMTYLTARYSCRLGSVDAQLATKNEIAKYIQPWSGYGEVTLITSP
jgi:hypothetical protein